MVLSSYCWLTPTEAVRNSASCGHGRQWGKLCRGEIVGGRVTQNGVGESQRLRAGEERWQKLFEWIYKNTDITISSTSPREGSVTPHSSQPANYLARCEDLVTFPNRSTRRLYCDKEKRIEKI